MRSTKEASEEVAALNNHKAHSAFIVLMCYATRDCLCMLGLRGTMVCLGSYGHLVGWGRYSVCLVPLSSYAGSHIGDLMVKERDDTSGVNWDTPL